MLRRFKHTWPQLGERVYVDASAQVIGDVTLGDDASVWMNTVIRGDVHFIRIGARSNVQDNCVIHVMTATHPTVVGEAVTVGHSVTLHGCTVEDLCLVGIGALVLNGAVIGRESIVGAGALVPEGMVVPPRSLVIGVPAKVRRPLAPEEAAELKRFADNYVGYKEIYLAEAAGRDPEAKP
jgi:carbonic anhydrase/acetyltransferase-like protein (isoleucine patch superfamily)